MESFIFIAIKQLSIIKRTFSNLNSFFYEHFLSQLKLFSETDWKAISNILIAIKGRLKYVYNKKILQPFKDRNHEKIISKKYKEKLNCNKISIEIICKRRKNYFIYISSKKKLN